ncbi:MAG: hypothetical protein ETSY1_16565 [Candidatus Entotheonella factor]|uniref:Uncharacterized protein n=1 Tax=Entotheonella factor TaxID=1429438 RepID=W4LM11_ENTF1|nr:MAG: hypothetical protein ETSY1_16565 [Candidatus Entotheonella factor]
MAIHQRQGGFTDEEFVPLMVTGMNRRGQIDSALN